MLVTNWDLNFTCVWIKKLGFKMHFKFSRGCTRRNVPYCVVYLWRHVRFHSACTCCRLLSVWHSDVTSQGFLTSLRVVWQPSLLLVCIPQVIVLLLTVDCASTSAYDGKQLPWIHYRPCSRYQGIWGEQKYISTHSWPIICYEGPDRVYRWPRR